MFNVHTCQLCLTNAYSFLKVKNESEVHRIQLLVTPWTIAYHEDASEQRNNDEVKIRHR